MANSTSEKFRLSKLEHELLFQSYHLESKTEFYEYLCVVLDKIYKHNREENESCDDLSFNMMKKSFAREAEKSKKESKKKLDESLITRQQFYELCHSDAKEKDLPQNILDLSSIAVGSIDETEGLEKTYLKKLYLCEEIEKFIKKYSKKLDSLEDESQKLILCEILELLNSQLPAETEEKERLCKVFRDKELQTYRGIAELIDELDMFDRKQPGK